MTGSVVYHTGVLAIDRKKDAALDARARGLLDRAEAGQVVLYQRRIGPGKFEYIAVQTAAASRRVAA
jgi:hypothetical protein